MNAGIFSYTPELTINDPDAFRINWAQELKKEYNCRAVNRVGIGACEDDLYDAIAFKAMDGYTDIIVEISEEHASVFKIDYEEICYRELKTFYPECFLSVTAFTDAIMKVVDEHLDWY